MIPEILYLEDIDNHALVLSFLSIPLSLTCDTQTNTQIYRKDPTISHFEVKNPVLIYVPFFNFVFAQSVSANAFLFRGEVLMWGIGDMTSKWICLESPGNKGAMVRLAF